MEMNLLEEISSSQGPLCGQHIIQSHPVGGGCIHNAWKIKLETGQQFFAKTSLLKHFKMLEFEANGLATINQKIDKNFLIAPEPLAIQKLVSAAILIMPWLDLGEGNERNLGKGLALLHKQTAAEDSNTFGWGTDGFIGYSPQLGGWKENWGECFVKMRFYLKLKWPLIGV